MQFKFIEGGNCAGIMIQINYEKIRNSKYVLQILSEILENRLEFAHMTNKESLNAIYDLIGYNNVEFVKFNNGQMFTDENNRQRIVSVTKPENEYPHIYEFSFRLVYKMFNLNFVAFEQQNEQLLHELNLEKILNKNKISINL